MTGCRSACSTNFEQSCEIVTRTHGVALHANVLEEDAGQFGSRLVSCGGSADGDGAAGAYGFDGMAPGGRATDSMTASTLCGSRVPVSKAASAPMAIARSRFSSLRDVTNYFQSCRMGELDGRCGHAAARALDEHGVSRFHVGRCEQQ